MRKIFLISMLILFIFCSTGYAELIDNGDGTVTDTKTGLMWQKADVGTKPWQEAFAYCEALVLARHSDWRLPDLNELQSIVNSIRNNPNTYGTVFPDPMSYNYWSSTAKDGATDHALCVFLKDGETYVELGDVYPGDKHNGQGVRAVRGGQ